MWNHVCNNAKIIKNYSLEPEISWFQALHHENTEIEKIAIIVCARKSLITYGNDEASVVLYNLLFVKNKVITLINLEQEIQSFL